MHTSAGFNVDARGSRVILDYVTVVPVKLDQTTWLGILSTATPAPVISVVLYAISGDAIKRTVYNIIEYHTLRQHPAELSRYVIFEF
jgi:hypothetical protein